MPVARRLTRAKRKITDAGIPYRIPPDAEIDARVRQGLAVVCLLFNEGYLTSGGDRPHARDLAGGTGSGPMRPQSNSSPM